MFRLDGNRYLVAILLAVTGLLATMAGAVRGAAEPGLQEPPPNTPGVSGVQPDAGPFVKIGEGVFMVPYTAALPGTDVEFDMVPVPGGTFLLGSPDEEEDRSEDEGPRVTVEVAPFWMGKHEVTWAEYKKYMGLQEPFKEFQTLGIRQVTEERLVDAITAPSALYDPSFTYDAGDHPSQPAATMTQYAARQYTKWLSLTSGHFYRLPGEAEWEYACRAGTTTPWSFGETAGDIADYAWLEDNADYERHRVGKKNPNPFGLFDMHGNVAEWTLDQYTEQGYSHLDPAKTHRATEIIRWPDAPDPLVARGGSFEMTADRLRSAARLASDNSEWKQEDPNSPKSPWWFTTEPSTGVGFRILRPWTVPESREEKERYWSEVSARDQYAIKHRIQNEGRGAQGLADPELPMAIRNLEEEKKD